MLLEFGFLSNAADTRNMLNPEWQEKCAAAVSDGILSYAKKVDTLDTAVAEKRKRDAEANERWRLHLASQAAKAATAQPVVAAPTNAGFSVLAKLSPSSSNLLCAAASLASSAVSTNAVPPDLNSLMHFYETVQGE